MSAPTVGIQWKGTDACIDFHCECGVSSHYDGYFIYAIKCGHCGAKYDMPQTLTLTAYSGEHEVVVAR